MDKIMPVTEESEEMIKVMSEELKKVGLEEFADHYLIAENDLPIFKIDKPFKKESESDPDTTCIILEVTEEYTVYTQYGHDHMDGAEEAARTVKGLFDGTFADISLNFKDVTMRKLVNHTGDPVQNIREIADHSDSVMKLIDFFRSMNADGHIHFASSPYPYQILPANNNTYGQGGFFRSVVIGEHPEVYLFP